MSMPYSIIYCDGCDYRGASHVMWGLFKYRFDDGHESYMERLLGWCSDCESVRPVEALPHPAVIERELIQVRERLHELTSNGIWSWAASALSRQRKAEVRELRTREADLAHMQEMMVSRTASPRCLRCGSTSTVPVPIRVQDHRRYDYAVGMAHPGCGGALRVCDSGGTRLAIATKLRVYTQEGELISATAEDHN